MPELDVWGAHWFRPDLVRLDPLDRLMLLDIAVLVADTADPDVPDGFLRSGGLNLLATLPHDFEDRLDRLESSGFLRKIDDPEGWLVVGWTERAQRPRPGRGPGVDIAWGQRPLDVILERRRRNAVYKSRSRSVDRTSGVEGAQEVVPR